MTQYKLRFMEGASLSVSLTEEEWFQVFLTGRYKDGDLLSIERADDPDKCVTFAENTNGQTPR